jgi:hypothetical protein
MASQTALNNMRICSKSWPSDHELFQRAVPRAPSYAALMDLVNRVTEAMREKDLLERRIGQILGSKVDAQAEWPTNKTRFRTAIAKLHSTQDRMGVNCLRRLRAAANKGIAEKRNLDASIVQILEGTFAGDFKKAYELWIAENPEGYTTPPGSPEPVSLTPEDLPSCNEQQGRPMNRSGECSPDCCCPYDGPCGDRDD